MPVLAKMAFLVAALRQDLIERAWHCIKSRVKASISAGIVAALLLPLTTRKPHPRISSISQAPWDWQPR